MRDAPSLLSLRFDMVQLAPCHHVQFGDGLCNLSQELLDYLKQFDTDGKGALSEEELQEVMRGRIRRAWNSRKGWGRGDQRMPGCLMKSVCTSKPRPVREQQVQVEPCRDSQTIPYKSRNKKKHIETYRHICDVSDPS